MEKLIFSKRAFTMPELMIAIFVLVLGIGSLIASFVNCLGLNEQARNLTVATSHAEYVLEEVRDTGFSEIAGKDEDWWSTWVANTVENAELNTLPQENISVSVSDPDSDPLTITVTVGWVERNRNRTESLTTEVTQ